MNSRSRSHREELFERLYKACYRDITAYVARRTTASDVGDVVAKVFAIAWRRLERVPQPPADRLWLFGVARRCLSDSQRSGNRQLRLRARLAREPGFAANTRQSVDADPRLELVLSAMASLTSNDREALRLVLWEELTHAQAAAVLNCTVNAFEIRYRRARNAVKDMVEKGTFAFPTGTTPINKPDIAKGVSQ